MEVFFFTGRSGGAEPIGWSVARWSRSLVCLSTAARCSHPPFLSSYYQRFKWIPGPLLLLRLLRLLLGGSSSRRRDPSAPCGIGCTSLWKRLRGSGLRILPSPLPPPPLPLLPSPPPPRTAAVTATGTATTGRFTTGKPRAPPPLPPRTVSSVPVLLLRRRLSAVVIK